MKLQHLLRIAWLAGIILGSTAPTHAISLILPTTSDANDLLQYCASPTEPPDFELRAYARGIMTSNVGPMSELDGGDMPARTFDGNQAYATAQYSGCLRMSYRRWWIGYGQGKRWSYDGNPDAAQLWIDLNSDGQTQPSYTAQASDASIATNWYAVGRDFPLRTGSIEGLASLCLRQISVPKFRARSIAGEMHGDMFTAQLRTVTWDTHHGDVGGAGWALDGQLKLKYKQWLGQMTVEGMLGEISWDGLQVEDASIVSPRTFTDPQGFLHDIGGITGAYWYENRSIRLDPLYRLDLINRGRPNILLGCIWQSGIEAAPNFGVAWPQPKRWLPYSRYYPVQGMLEIGAVGLGWEVRAAEGRPFSGNPKHLEVGLSVSAIRF
jgi:hypothetical protein